MSKPTPGPWEVGEYRDEDGTLAGIHSHICVAAPHVQSPRPNGIRLVAVCGDAGAPLREQSIRDAALIADAPALLDALEACVRRFEVTGQYYPDAIDGVTAMIANDARALLRKHGRLNSEETHG